MAGSSSRWCWVPTRSAISNKDEARYVRQALFYSEGKTAETEENALTGEFEAIRPGLYPPATSILMSPFVRVFGWRGTYVVPFLSLLLAVVMTGLWIRGDGGSPLFALVIMGFPASLVLGRIAISDAPSMAVVVAGLLCFWKGLDGDRPGIWLAAGFLAGASICWRETNAFIFAPFFLGAVLRRDQGVWALVVGGIAGVLLKLGLNSLIFDDPLFYKIANGFSFASFISNTPKYLVGLMIFVPAGLLAGLTYRGRRAIELRVAVLLVFMLYAFYNYSGAPSGFMKSLVLGQRFFMPLIPLLAFALAERVPHWWSALQTKLASERVPRLAGLGVAAWVAGLVVASIGVHVFIANWASATQGQMREAIRTHVDHSKVIVTNLNMTEKIIDRFDYSFDLIHRNLIDFDGMMTLLDRHQEFYLIIVDRNESEKFLRDSRRSASFLEPMMPFSDLVLDDQVSRAERLRIWRVTREHAERSANAVDLEAG